jgi:hypothetical protein
MNAAPRRSRDESRSYNNDTTPPTPSRDESRSYNNDTTPP